MAHRSSRHSAYAPIGAPAHNRHCPTHHLRNVRMRAVPVRAAGNAHTAKIHLIPHTGAATRTRCAHLHGLLRGWHDSAVASVRVGWHLRLSRITLYYLSTDCHVLRMGRGKQRLHRVRGHCLPRKGLRERCCMPNGTLGAKLDLLKGGSIGG